MLFILHVLHATDRDCIGSIDTFNVNGFISEAESECVRLAVFVLAPEAGASAKMAETAVVKAITRRECEETKGIETRVLPETSASQFATVGLFSKMA